MYVAPKVKPLCPPEKSPRFEDVEYGVVTLDDGSEYSLKLDIYQSKSQSKPGPCIIYIFGGGWLWGEYKQVTQKAVYCRDLVRLTDQGYTVVCPDYRLASQAVFPACIHDVKGVVRFLKANGEKYNIDKERIGVLGNSAGGHSALMLALSEGEPFLEGDVGGNLQESSGVKAAVVYYGPADLCKAITEAANQLRGKKRDLTGTEIEDLHSDDSDQIPALIVGYKGESKNLLKLEEVLKSEDENNLDYKYIELTKKCSPMTYVKKDVPPLLLLHGGKDVVVSPSQSENLYQALCSKGADVTLIEYSIGAHGPSLGPDIDNFAYNFLTNRL